MVNDNGKKFTPRRTFIIAHLRLGPARKLGGDLIPVGIGSVDDLFENDIFLLVGLRSVLLARRKGRGVGAGALLVVRFRLGFLLRGSRHGCLVLIVV